MLFDTNFSKITSEVFVILLIFFTICQQSFVIILKENSEFLWQLTCFMFLLWPTTVPLHCMAWVCMQRETWGCTVARVCIILGRNPIVKLTGTGSEVGHETCFSCWSCDWIFPPFISSLFFYLFTSNYPYSLIMFMLHLRLHIFVFATRRW